MRDQTAVHKYKVHLPIAVRGVDQANAQGVTNHLSKRFIRFWVEKPLPVLQGSAVMLFVCLPKELTTDTGLLMRARAKVLGVKQTSVGGVNRQTFTAKLDWYDFMPTARPAPRFIPARKSA